MSTAMKPPVSNLNGDSLSDWAHRSLRITRADLARAQRGSIEEAYLSGCLDMLDAITGKMREYGGSPDPRDRNPISD